MRCLPIWITFIAAATAAHAGGARIDLSPNGERLEGWTFSAGPEFPGAKGALDADADGLLHLRYDFTEGGAYVAAYRALDSPQEIGALTFRIRKPAEATLTVRVTDSTGQTVQKSVQYEYGGWQTLRAEMGAWTGHWGGADDGMIHQPVRQIGILIESRDLESKVGEVLIADVAAELGAPAADRVRRGSYVVTDFKDGIGFGTSGPATFDDGVWRIDFSQGDSAALHTAISLLGRPRAIRMEVRGGAAGNVLKLRIGSHFQTFERALGELNGSEQVFEFPAPPDGWTYFGGENDGVARLPLRVTAILVERGNGPAKPVEIELRELRCITDVNPTRPVILLAQDATPEMTAETTRFTATVRAWNLLDEPIVGELAMTARDWEGNVRRTETRPWTLPARGMPTEERFQIELPASRHFMEATFRFRAEGLVIPPTSVTFTHPASDAGDPSLRSASPWGMGVYLYRYPDNPDGYRQMDHAAAMAQAAGVKWSREEFSWARIESREGEYDFRFYDQVVDTARRHGISVYGLLAYWSRWTEPYTEQGIEDYVRFARATVRHFKDRVKHWEVYNEPNIFFWSGPKELYPVLLSRAYEAIKQEDPDAEVLGISTAGIDTRFIQQSLDAKAPFDVLTVHPYRARLRESAFMRELRDVAMLVGGRPVWITEMGWSTQVGATDERTQAELLARTYLAAVASGASQNVSWYDFRSDGRDPFYNEANFGVLRNDLRPKPAYRALMTIARTLDDGEPVPVEGFGEGIYALEMGDAMALWSPQRSQEVIVRVTTGKPEAQNLMGERLDVRTEQGEMALKLRAGSPVFVTGARIEPTGRTIPIEPPDHPDLIRF